MFDESKHPRDDDGKFANGTGKSYRQNVQYDEILKPDADETSQNKKDYGRYKSKIHSTVFEKISTVKKELDKCGSCQITVYDMTHIYRVRLYGANNDYDFDIIKIQNNQ